jgi:MFS transporter, UMF1 family
VTEINNKKVINAWCMYDWANSAYSLVITTAIFPIYFSAVAKGADGSDMIDFFGFAKKNSVVYTYSLSFAFLLVAFISPLLSGIADYGGRKKTFMQFFILLGSISCMMLFFFNSDTVLFGIVFFILATIGFAGSLVFYNAYLPEIASPDRHDKVSAKGFSLGYIGSVILLIFNLLMIEMPHLFGLPAGTSLPVRISFLSVGVWWFLFAQYSMYHLPKGSASQKITLKIITHGFREIKKVFKLLKEYQLVKRFLMAFFFYMMGFQTIMYLASMFGASELKIDKSGLIAIIIVIQLVAIGGAYMFSKMSSLIGNIKTLLLGVCVCIGICIAAWFITTPVEFYILAVVVGLIMGGMQSLSRSTYSKLVPDTKDSASWFSFYEFTEKIGIVLGTAVYALITDMTGSMRNSILALIVFFVLGLSILIKMTYSAKMKTV